LDTPKRLAAHAALALALALAAPARAGQVAAPVDGRPAHFDPGGLWHGLRWKTPLAELLKILEGEARLLDKPVTLKDGHVVAAAIPTYRLEGQDYVVRFVFESGRLALVSLRTQEDRYAKPEVYEKMARWLDERFGQKGEEGKDDNFIDLRQFRWRLPEGQVDLKYIPGVVVILYSAPAAS
jgi:hypothetical protein